MDFVKNTIWDNKPFLFTSIIPTTASLMFGQWDGDGHYYAAQVTKYIGGNRWVFGVLIVAEDKIILSVNMFGF